MNKWAYSFILILFIIMSVLIKCIYMIKGGQWTDNRSHFNNFSSTDINNSSKETEIKSDNNILNIEDIIRMIGCEEITYNSEDTFSVAILDSGTFPHDNFSNSNEKIIHFIDFVNKIEVPYDDNGHGTAVAGLIASDSPNYKGVAPFVDIVSVKVLDYKGQCNKNTLLRGIQWVIDNKEKYNIKIMNISIGIPTDDYDEVSKKIDEAYSNGIFVVTSVGNYKDSSEKMYSPAISDSAIAVGAIDEQEIKLDFDYHIADFSLEWETPNSKHKPDIIAPGKNILTMQSNIYYKGKGDITRTDLYKINSGTSLSSAIVTGFVANLIYKNPKISVEKIKSMLYENCKEIKIGDKKEYFIYYKGEEEVE